MKYSQFSELLLFFSHETFQIPTFSIPFVHGVKETYFKNSYGFRFNYLVHYKRYS